MAEAQESRREAEPYEQFLHRFAQDRERIFAYIYSLVPHHADAEDIFQRCSLVLWRKFNEFRHDNRFLTWACGIAYFEVRNYLRKAGRNRVLFDDALMRQLSAERTESLSRHDDRLMALRTCLQGLTDDQRELINAAYGCDGTVKVLAEAQGNAVQTLYNRLGRLRRQLLRCVEGKLAAQG